MMDMMFIILVFLIKQVGEEPIPISESDDLRMTMSTSELPPEDMLTITITRLSVMVLDQAVVQISDGAIDPSELQSAESAVIPQLQQHIEERLRENDQWAALTGREQSRVVTIIAHNTTPYRLLTQVMITASQAGVQNFKFAILRRQQGRPVGGQTEGG